MILLRKTLLYSLTCFNEYTRLDLSNPAFLVTTYLAITVSKPPHLSQQVLKLMHNMYYLLRVMVMT